MVREPIFAGQFYPRDPLECAQQLQTLVPDQADQVSEDLPARAALVPHAGWMCSGRVTGRVFRTLSGRTSPTTVVLLGAVHAPRGRLAAVCNRGSWRTPLGSVAIDEDLADALCAVPEIFEANPGAHREEHSLEVQVPFVQTLFPAARILPVMVPPSPVAPWIGTTLGRILRDRGADAVIISTSDLTHYGPAYRFTPHGVGQMGLDWAKRINDRLMIDRILALDAEGIVPEAAEHHNACGPGAIAAVIAAARELGAARVLLLEHTTSQETLAGLLPGSVNDAVGYAGVIFCN